MATITRDADYSAEKQNNILEVNILIRVMHFWHEVFVNSTLNFLSSRCLLSLIIIYMIIYGRFNTSAMDSHICSKVEVLKTFIQIYAI